MTANMPKMLAAHPNEYNVLYDHLLTHLGNIDTEAIAHRQTEIETIAKGVPSKLTDLAMVGMNCVMVPATIFHET